MRMPVTSEELIEGDLYYISEEPIIYEGKTDYGKHVFRYLETGCAHSTVEMVDHNVPRMIHTRL